MKETEVLFKDGKFMYSVLTSIKCEEAKSVQVEGFADEPTSIFRESDRNERLKQWSVFADFFAEECSSNGLSTICIDSENGNVAGVFWARDFKAPLPSNFNVDHLPCLSAAVEVLIKLDEAYETLRPDLNTGDCVDLWMLAVHPDYRRQGIGKRLTSVAKDWVATKGFKYVVLESTGGFSARCASSVGMKMMVEKKYCLESEALRGMPLEHDAMRFWELEV